MSNFAICVNCASIDESDNMQFVMTENGDIEVWCAECYDDCYTVEEPDEEPCHLCRCYPCACDEIYDNWRDSRLGDD